MIPIEVFESHSNLITEHLLRLDQNSRRMRFGHVVSDNAIEQYVTRSFTLDDNVWYAIIDQGKVIAAAHVAIDNHVCELGLSVDSDMRGNGHANSLFERALTHIKSLGVTTVTMQCLSENKAMQHIARKNGMRLVTLGGGETEASVQVDPGNPVMATMSDIHSDVLSLIDTNIRNQYWILDSVMSLFYPKSK